MMTAWLFPGQGCQYPGMGRSLWEHASARHILQLAEETSELPLRVLMQQGPAESLRRPEVLEPALAAVQLAYVSRLRECAAQPDVVAGYSMGEIGALFAAGVIGLEDALKIASLRGKVLQTALYSGAWRMISAAAVPSGYQPGAGTEVAAWNGPGNVTIAGDESRVRTEERILIGAGAKVSDVFADGPWHTQMAQDAANAIAEQIHGFSFHAPSVPVFLGSTGNVENRPEEMRTSLARQIAKPILWSKVLQGLWKAGVRKTLEVGPGRTLTAFLRINWSNGSYVANFLERENSCNKVLFPLNTGPWESVNQHVDR